MKPGATCRSAAGLSTVTLHDLNAVPPDVEQLFAQAEQEDPQLGLAWYRNLSATVFGPDADLRIHVLRRHEKTIAALPVFAKRTSGAREVYALGNYYTSLFAPAVCDSAQASDLAVLLQHLIRAHAPVKSVRIAPMAIEGRGLTLLMQAATHAGLVPFDYFCFGNWYLPVAGDAEGYLASRPGEVRNTLRRMGKKFVASGGRFEIVSAPHQAAQAAAEFTRVYGSSWKQPEPYQGFIPGLATLCAQKGWLRMGLAMVGSQVVAAQFWIVASQKANIYKLAYDPAFRQLSPGSLLTAHLMRHVIDVDKVREVDYLCGDDAYKNQWMTHRRERRGLIAFNPRTAGGLTGLLLESCARGLKPLLKHRRKRLSVSDPGLST